ncbi:hypothetical protein FH608_017265 [Nonomuraea phyllanthi]|uniref:Uncharacterized protein n=1 Tax=Nonomuraea phyllanthi TaxID=2219224 RepID=A0A5C4WJI3_9ACTN|nr:DUF5988 family protein [Nonomuraea phyllanthi]KAB8193953.1 hypothetical protein FH608_017265 [Nonomuraea phyllanthi]QFY07543.1 hypothetical protein GBF35_13385 [Nonomuraea phyllanthi]
MGKSVAHGLVDVVLEGGPAYVPRELRVEHAAALDGKIKVPYGAGYEHFVRVADAAPGEWVFRWSMRTRIAE